MAKFPEPPSVSDLAAITPELTTLFAGERLWRVYRRGGRHAAPWNALRRFGPTESRFDHHRPPPREQERAVLYCAAQGPTALGEHFQRPRVIDRRFASPWLVGFALARPVALLDLRSTWPTRAGASMAINTGPRPRARRWSRVIYEAYPWVEGLLYPSSMVANEDAVVLYDRAASALPDRPSFHRPLDDPDLFAALVAAARTLGYRIV